MKSNPVLYTLNTVTSIEGFLTRNSFQNMGNNTYVNKECSIKILKDCYEIEFVDVNLGEVIIYTDSLNIPQLAGMLTWYNLIDRNYSK